MTDPLVNTEGLQSGDRVQVEARGRVLDTEVRSGVPWAQVMLTTPGGAPLWLPVWLPVDMVVLLDPRTTP